MLKDLNGLIHQNLIGILQMKAQIVSMLNQLTLMKMEIINFQVQDIYHLLKLLQVLKLLLKKSFQYHIQEIWLDLQVQKLYTLLNNKVQVNNYNKIFLIQSKIWLKTFLEIIITITNNNNKDINNKDTNNKDINNNKDNNQLSQLLIIDEKTDFFHLDTYYIILNSFKIFFYYKNIVFLLKKIIL